MNGWIAVDLDGVLANLDHDNFDPVVIGEPCPPDAHTGVSMVDRVKQWIEGGTEVRVFTARVSTDGTPERDEEVAVVRKVIEAWCDEHIGQVLPITNVKDWQMIALWDDRAVKVWLNTSVPLLAVDKSKIKGEPGTGYESPLASSRDFHCEDCIYFRAVDSGCSQNDMMLKSARTRLPDGCVLVEPRACCEYIDRIET